MALAHDEVGVAQFFRHALHLVGRDLPAHGGRIAAQRLIGKASREDDSYLKGQLQEARWLLKSVEARGETLLKVCVDGISRELETAFD